MESQTYSQTLSCRIVCRQPGLLPYGFGFPMGPQYLVRKIDSSEGAGEWVRPVKHAKPVSPERNKPAPPVVVDENGDPDDKAAYEGRYPQESLRFRRFYNLAPGKFWHPFWTNVDRASGWGDPLKADAGFIDVDLLRREPFPVGNDSAELVYSGHALSHLTDEGVRHVLLEAFRILKPGGYLRTSTPDILLEYRAFQDRDWPFYSWRDFYSKPGNYEHLFNRPLNQASIQQLFLWRFASHVSTLHASSPTERIGDEEVDKLFSTLPMNEALDYCSSRCLPALQRQGPSSHISWWSFEKMSRAMTEVGFREVFRSGYGQSFAPPMRNTKIFDKTRPPASLYVEARK